MDKQDESILLLDPERTPLPARVRRLFDVVTDLGEAERLNMLDHARTSDPHATELVLKLLDSSEQDRIGPLWLAEEHLSQSSWGNPEDLTRLLPDGAAIDTPAGPGQVEALLSAPEQCALAEVYRVRLDAGGLCAVKVLRESMATADARRRFRLEAEALRRLEHPCIARLLAAGVVSFNQNTRMPAIVMQLVRGQPLDRWAVDKPVADTARALITVARTMHYAHLRGVMHRDLKPSNILVDSDDRPFILDLGVARLISSESEHDEYLTLSTTIVGTPHYMAPEQLTPSTRTVDLRADVYALGLMLYELVCGKPMLSVAGLSQAEALKRKLTARPVLPRGTGMRAQIIQVALGAATPEPDNRYDSAEAFANDLERALSGFPLRLRPVGFIKRTILYTRRHWLLCLAASSVLTGMMLSMGVYMASQRQVSEARDRAVDRFNDTRNFTNWVIDDLIDMLSFQHGTAHARRQIIDQAATTLTALAADSDAPADLILELAEAYAKLAEVLADELGDFPAAGLILENADTLLDRHPNQQTPLFMLLKIWIHYKLHYTRSNQKYGIDLAAFEHDKYSRITQLQGLEDDSRYWRWRSVIQTTYSRRLVDEQRNADEIIGVLEQSVADAHTAFSRDPSDPLSLIQTAHAPFWLAHGLIDVQHPTMLQAANDALMAAHAVHATGHPQGLFLISRATMLLAGAHILDGNAPKFEQLATEAIEIADHATAQDPSNKIPYRNAEVARVILARRAIDAHRLSLPVNLDIHIHRVEEAIHLLERRTELGWGYELELERYMVSYPLLLKELREALDD